MQLKKIPTELNPKILFHAKKISHKNLIITFYNKNYLKLIINLFLFLKHSIS